MTCRSSFRKREDIVRCQDDRSSRQALTGDAKRAIMMDICRVESEGHLVLNSGLLGTSGT